jgi:hypothetical protein
MKIKSDFAILDVKDGRDDLAFHFAPRPRMGPCPESMRIPITIVGYIDGINSKDDGISREFTVVVEHVNPVGWQPMETAPLDGKHCILAIKCSAFVYAIQGAFMKGKWMNAADIQSEPLCWMPNIMIPDEFLPWMKAAS